MALKFRHARVAKKELPRHCSSSKYSPRAEESGLVGGHKEVLLKALFVD